MRVHYSRPNLTRVGGVSKLRGLEIWKCLGGKVIINMAPPRVTDSVWYTVHSVRDTVHCILHTVYVIQYIVYCIQCTWYSTLYTVHSVCDTVHCILHTVYVIQYIVYCIQCTWYSILYTVYVIQYTVCTWFVVYVIQLKRYSKLPMYPECRLRKVCRTMQHVNYVYLFIYLTFHWYLSTLRYVFYN